MPAVAQSFHMANKTIAPSKPDAPKPSGTERSGEGNRRAAWGDQTRGHPALFRARIGRARRMTRGGRVTVVLRIAIPLPARIKSCKLVPCAKGPAWKVTDA